MHHLRNICLPFCLSAFFFAFIHGDAITDFAAVQNLITIIPTQVQDTINVDDLILNRTLANYCPIRR